jgi:hypothetical protein
MRPVLESMIEASTVANNTNSLMGNGLINRFQIGAGLAVGAVKKDDINFTYGDISFPKLPNAGVAVSPSVMVGFNLGWILGEGPALDRDKKDKKKENSESESEESDETDEEEMVDSSFLHRFNFFFHGMKFGYTVPEMKGAYSDKPELSGGAKVQSFGGTIRFTLMEPRYALGSLFAFNGFNLGLGYHAQSFSIDITHEPRTNPIINFGELSGTWIAKTEFDFASNIRSIPFDIRTGVNLFYFLDLYAGVGFSRNFGQANLHLYRSGTLVLSNNISTIYNATAITTDYYQYFNNPNSRNLNPDGNFTVDIRNKTNVNNSTNYLIVGTELKLLFLRLVAEGLILEKSYGASLGLKFSF